jgi:uncharacterized protein YaiE (UPF0345 family)
MLPVNSYFEGKVKSIGFTNNQGRATVGVMEPGEYEFGTSTVEYMTVISGILTVMLPGEKQWKDYGKNETFVVPANAKFQLRLREQTAYYCRYE